MRIVVLIHERERIPFEKGYTLGLVTRVWREWGHEVIVVAGPGRHVDADLAIAQVDLTFMPSDYVEYVSRYPITLNARLNDISKRSFSELTLTRDSSWNGRVIVKTNLNCRGSGEKRLLGRVSDRDLLRHLPVWLSVRIRHRIQRARSPFREYVVFDSIDRVPPRIWKDDAFVVERFVAERDGDDYILRRCNVLGDVTVNHVFRSRVPVAHGPTMFDPRRVDPPEELLSIRDAIGLDFGRLDYSIVDGRVVLYDINKTPSARPSPRMIGIATELAAGLRRFHPSGG